MVEKSAYIIPAEHVSMNAYVPHPKIVEIKRAGYWLHEEKPKYFL
jgi:hypothetical protein